MRATISALVLCLLLGSPTASSAYHKTTQPWGSEADEEGDDSGYEQEAEDAQQENQVVGPKRELALAASQSVALPWMVSAGSSPAPSAAPQQAPAPHEVARAAAKSAKKAAKIANQVAKHSVKMTKTAKKALKHALGALHDARVDTSGLDHKQKHSLKKAEAHLREATKKAEYGQLEKTKDEEKMEKDLKNKGSSKTEKEELRQRIESLRQQLKDKKVYDEDINKALSDLEADLDEDGGASKDEIKAELERLSEKIDKIRVKRTAKPKNVPTQAEEAVTPVQEKGIDIDTQMPFGDLEPFGREDTAQELTERSITESDGMVDQLERAEVSEEKRAVFRALTRLRGAAITSFDGVARTQTGNIDEYNKVHKWRNSHPLHHLADEESDVSKWAFPENADFLQKAP